MLHIYLFGWLLVGFTAYQPFSGHLTPNKILNTSVDYKYSFCLQTVKTVLFRTILFSISTQFQCQKQFNFKQFSLAQCQKQFFFK